MLWSSALRWYISWEPSALLTVLITHCADGVGAGLDFDAALKDPAMVKFQGSPQARTLWFWLCADRSGS